MSDKITLKLDVDAKDSIKTLDSLETHLDELKKKVRGVEVGSKEFKSLASEIKKTESQVKNLNKSMEGLDIDQVTGEFGRLTGGITAAFTGIISLSGEANESMENMVKTVAKGMAIAQGFRGAAEAASAATRVWATVQGFLNKAMKSNPIGVLITAITVLVGAIVLLVRWFKKDEDAADDATDAHLRYKEAIGEVSLEIGFKLITALKAQIKMMKDAQENQEKYNITLKGTTTELELFSQTIENFTKSEIESMILAYTALIENTDETKLSTQEAKNEYEGYKNMLIILTKKLEDFGTTTQKTTEKLNEVEQYIKNNKERFEEWVKTMEEQMLMEKTLSLSIISEINKRALARDQDLKDREKALQDYEQIWKEFRENTEFEEDKPDPDDEAEFERLMEIAAYERDIRIQNEMMTQEGLKQLYEEGVINYAEYQNRLLTLDENNKQKRIMIAQATFAGISQLMASLTSFYEQQKERELEAAGDNEEKKIRIEKEYAEKKKKISLIQAIINVAQGITSALTLPWPASFIMAALTAAAGAIQIDMISRQKFAAGGILYGPSHASGGISTPYGELEGGEGIINKSSMANASLRNIASSINTSTGGKDFSTGDGSIKLSNETLELLAYKINDKKVYVTETDISETQKRVSVIEEDAIL